MVGAETRKSYIKIKMKKMLYLGKSVNTVFIHDKTKHVQDQFN